jgi:hypothetical protein
MICERCGNEIQGNTIICPACGTASRRAKVIDQPATSYSQYPHSSFGEHQAYHQGYGAQSSPVFPQQAAYIPAPHNPGYVPPFYNAASVYPISPMNYTGASGVKFSNKSDGALVVEIMLSLFGVFGVGWLMAKETTLGTILLICSVFIYWPVLILGTIFTFGLGLLCLGPLAIGAIILNALLLNNNLNRKAAEFVILSPPYMPSQR